MIKNRTLLIITVLIINIGFNYFLAFTVGDNYFNINTWSRWDSGHYLHIAEKGYFIDDQREQGGIVEGNAAWFPSYSWLIKGIANTLQKTSANDYKIIGSYVPKFFLILCLILIAAITQLNTYNFRAILILSISTFWFGGIFYHANYPISFLMFWILLAIYCYRKQMTLIVITCCFLASLCYSTGFLLGCALALTSTINNKNRTLLSILKDGLKYVLPSFAGVIFVFYFQFLQTNHYNAFFMVQSNYGNGGIRFFIAEWIQLSAQITKRIQTHHYKLIYYIQSAVVALLYCSYSYYAFKNKLFKNTDTTLFYVIVSVFLIFPWTIGGNLSMYRVESLILPSVFLVQNLNWKYLLSLLLILITIATMMTPLFFQNRLM